MATTRQQGSSKKGASESEQKARGANARSAGDQGIGPLDQDPPILVKPGSLIIEVRTGSGGGRSRLLEKDEGTFFKYTHNKNKEIKKIFFNLKNGGTKDVPLPNNWESLAIDYKD